MPNTKTTKYIYHSEKTKTTCENCKKHDKEVYYDIADIPKLPIHPNCKCWIEVVELKNNDNGNTKCDCRNKFEVLINNTNNAIANSKAMIDSYKKELDECLITIDNLNKEQEKETISNQDKEKYQELIYKIEDKIYYFEKDVNKFINECENLLTDIETTKEYKYDPTYHTIDECYSNKELKEHSKKLSDICSRLDNFSNRLNEIKENRKETTKRIENILKEESKKHVKAEVYQELTLKEKTYEKLGNAVSPLFTIAGANLQDSLNDFKAAKKNEHAEIKSSVNDLKNKNLENSIINNLKIPTNTRGVVYDTNSKESKQLFNSNEIQQIVNDLKNTAQPNIENFQFYINNNIDNYLALQHCTLYNPHITQDRYFEVTIIDYWDFDYRKQKNKKDFREYLSNDINNWGYSMQEKNRMENYYVIYHIKEKI